MFAGAPDGDDGPFPLATASGMSELSRWAAGLPDDLPAVKAFVEQGEFAGTDELSRQLVAAMKDHRPPKHVRHTAIKLLKVMGVGDPEETATVTEGETADDE